MIKRPLIQIDGKYAFALFLETPKSELDAVLETLNKICSFLSKNPNLNKLLSGKTLSSQQRSSMLMELCEIFKVQERLVEFLLLVSKNKRFYLLKKITESFQRKVDEEFSRVRVIVKCASNPSKENKKSMEDMLTISWKKNIIVSYELDESLIGGVSIFCDNVCFDSSIAAQLKNLRKILKQQKG